MLVDYEEFRGARRYDATIKLNVWLNSYGDGLRIITIQESKDIDNYCNLTVWYETK